MKPLGIKLPIEVGPNGYFDQHFDSIAQIKTNLYNFFATKKGERRFNKTCFSKINELLFENEGVIDGDVITQSIRKELEKNFPSLIINSINITKQKQFDNYTVRIAIIFTYKKEESSIEIAL